MGIGKMICVLVLDDEPIARTDKVIATAIQKARISKTPYISIVFLSTSSTNVFKYRDVFTKYIDIGVRVYIEHNIENLKKIMISENCKNIYIPSGNENLRRTIAGLGIAMNIEEV
jgi:hypothetical protein